MVLYENMVHKIDVVVAVSLIVTSATNLTA